MADPINPDHYRQGSVECIEAIRAALGADGFRAYCKGQVLKYLWRADFKHDDPKTDLGKANWYMQRLLQEAER
jgi:hypothetical protein